VCVFIRGNVETTTFIREIFHCEPIGPIYRHPDEGDNSFVSYRGEDNYKDTVIGKLHYNFNLNSLNLLQSIKLTARSTPEFNIENQPQHFDKTIYPKDFRTEKNLTTLIDFFVCNAKVYMKKKLEIHEYNKRQLELFN